MRPDDKRYWYMACYCNGKRKLLSFGPFSKVTLKQARKARKKAQSLLDQGIDPVQHKKELKRARMQADEKKLNQKATASSNLQSLHAAKAGKVTDAARDLMLRQLELHLFPKIGKKHIEQIKGAELLAILREVAEKTNHGRPMTYMAKKLCQWAGEVFDFAMVENHDFSNNLCRTVTKYFPRHTTQNMARIRFSELPQFLTALDNYPGHGITKTAIYLLLYTGMRQISVRRARWQDL